MAGLAVALMAAWAAPAGAANVSLTTGDGNGADSYVRSGAYADETHGDETWLLLKRHDPIEDWERKTYLRFDLSSLDGPVTDATLNLTFLKNSNDPQAFPSEFTFDIWGLDDGEAGDEAPGDGGWTEDGATWNNAPGNLSGSASLVGSFDVSTDAAEGHVVEVSGNSLTNFLADDTTGFVTMILTRQNDHGAVTIFASKEHADFDGPTLALTTSDATTVIPEPASMALLGLGGMMLLRRRRRTVQA